MRLTTLATLLALTAAPVAAMDDHVPLTFDQATGHVGAPVLSFDAITIGRLVAVRPQGDGSHICIVRLDGDPDGRTSPLIVNGLLRAADGSLRLPETASMLSARMNLPLVSR